MSTYAYIVEKPEQLLALYALCPAGNRMMENLARVWRAQQVLASANFKCPSPKNWAVVEFDTVARKCRVLKRFGRSDGSIGMLPYNKALGYCKETLTRENKARRQ